LAEECDFMGKYDMAATYQETYACTITDLCNEILDEAEKSTLDKDLNYDLVRSKFSNAQGSGIIEKLKSAGFDVWKIAGKDRRERYAALKILKKFYYIEKDNVCQRKRVNITRILSDPCIDHFEAKENKEAFDDLYQSVYGQVEERVVYEQAICSLDKEWKSLINGLSRFIYRPDLVSRYDEICETLKRADDQLKAIALHRTLNAPDSNDGIMRTLLLLLVRYRILAMNNSIKRGDDDTLRLETAYDKKLATGYLDKANTVSENILWDRIDAVTKTLKMNVDSLKDYMDEYGVDSFTNLYIQTYALGSITNCDIVSPENKTHRVNAFRYAKVAAMWIQSLYYDLDFSEGVPTHVLPGIVQSLYYVSKNHVKYSVSSHGNAEKKTLLAALKKGVNADKVAMLNMESRVADRILIVLGKKEMLDYYHSIRRILLEMEDAVISCHSLKLIQERHNKVFEQVREICSRIS